MYKRIALAMSPFVVFTLACYAEVPGDRAVNGCPEGEVCSNATPGGLVFSGEAFYDEGGQLRLGPLLVGGTFDVGFRAPTATIDHFRVQTSDRDVLTASAYENPLEVDLAGSARVEGKGAGEASVRVTDAKGQLYDRLPMDVYAIDHVNVQNLVEPDVDILIQGCEAMLGVHLMVKDGDLALRAFDSSVAVTANGDALEAEGNTWDCFVFTPTTGMVDLDVYAGGEHFAFKYKVRPLGPDEACPERPTD